MVVEANVLVVASAKLIGPQVDDGRHDRFDDGELRAQSQRQQHEEEKEGPERRHGKLRHCLRVHDESQSGACNRIPSGILLTLRFVGLARAALPWAATSLMGTFISWAM